MKRITTADRVRVIQRLAEGCSMRATVRTTGVALNTVIKLLVSMGDVCRKLHDGRVRCLNTARVQFDEIWSFVGCKQKQVDRGGSAVGDVWTWTAIDADTKLCIAYLVGGRDPGSAYDFTHDLAGRLHSRVQLTTDGLNMYLEGIMEHFGTDVDYAQLVKLYGDDPRLKAKNLSARYSPGVCTGCEALRPHRPARPQAHQHQLCRASEPDDAHVDAAIHSSDERLLEEGDEP